MSRRLIPFSWLFLFFAACTLGPDPSKPPPIPLDVKEPFVQDQGVTKAFQEPHAWWRSFLDPITEKLIEEALQKNPQVLLAAQRILEAEGLMQKALGSRMPQSDFNFQADRTKFSFVLPNVGRVGIYSTTFSWELQVSYQVDLFGKLKRTAQAAWADLLATQIEREEVVHTLITQVLRLRIALSVLEKQIDIAHQVEATWELRVRQGEMKYWQGLLDYGEYEALKKGKHQAHQATQKLEQQRWETQTALTILLGKRPTQETFSLPPLPENPSFPPLPPGLPVGLLDRRPDILAAQARFSAASARVGVALANLFPSLNLSASGGITGDYPEELTDTAGLIYSAVMGLVTPLWKGGSLRGEVKAQKARLEQAALAYQEAILKAIKEVEDALKAEKTLKMEWQDVKNLVDLSKNTFSYYQKAYQQGLVPLEKLLDARQAWLEAEQLYWATLQRRYEVRLALIQALGGSWEDKS